MATQKKLAKKVVDSNGVSFVFADGKEKSYGLNDLSEEMVQRLAVHGLSQKLGDSYSGAKGPTEARELAEKEWAKLLRGNWSERDSSGGIVIEAIARYKGISVTDAQVLWEKASEDQRDAVRGNAKVKALITIIRGERAQAKVTEEEDEDLGI